MDANRIIAALENKCLCQMNPRVESQIIRILKEQQGLKMYTPKEITINYLKDIQKDLESAIEETNKSIRIPVILRNELRIITDAIATVEESEGE